MEHCSGVAPVPPEAAALVQEYLWVGGTCYAICKDGTHTRGYLHQRAAALAVLRGATFTPDQFVRHVGYTPAFYYDDY